LIGRDVARLEAAVSELQRLGVRACYAQADVADPQAVEVAADTIETELGAVDIWVNTSAPGDLGGHADGCGDIGKPDLCRFCRLVSRRNTKSRPAITARTDVSPPASARPVGEMFFARHKAAVMAAAVLVAAGALRAARRSPRPRC
jgi:hypothetical protein